MTRYTYMVPGIYTPLQDARTWDYQAQAWLHDGGYGEAAGLNYSADWVGGLASRDRFADLVAADLVLAVQSGMGPIDVVGHSNGCRILLRALVKEPRAKIRRLHLIAAAAPEDCSINGLNTLADSHQVEQVVLYVSPVDEVLGIGELLGYGDLGKKGPVNIRPDLAGILQRVDGECKHCDWVTRDFQQTMQRIAGDVAGGD